jgi:hypothetical protein
MHYFKMNESVYVINEVEVCYAFCIQIEWLQPFVKVRASSRLLHSLQANASESYFLGKNGICPLVVSSSTVTSCSSWGGVPSVPWVPISLPTCSLQALLCGALTFHLAVLWLLPSCSAHLSFLKCWARIWQPHVCFSYLLWKLLSLGFCSYACSEHTWPLGCQTAGLAQSISLDLPEVQNAIGPSFKYSVLLASTSLPLLLSDPVLNQLCQKFHGKSVLSALQIILISAQAWGPLHWTIFRHSSFARWHWLPECPLCTDILVFNTHSLSLFCL